MNPNVMSAVTRPTIGIVATPTATVTHLSSATIVGTTPARVGIVAATVTIAVLLGAMCRRAIVEPRPARRPPADRHLDPRPGRSLVPRAASAGLAGLAITVGIATAGWPATASVAAAVLLGRRARPVIVERRHRRAARRQLPEAIERLVLLVHAGLTPHEAVRAACSTVPHPVRHGFDAVVHRLERGAPIGDALEALTAELGNGASGVADAFAAADRYGLPLEPMLDQLAHDARTERRRLDEADARRLPVKLAFPLVACTLPSFVLVSIAPAVIAALSSLGGNAW